MEQCSSCKANIANKPGTVTFACPQCGKTTIIRCPNCRKTAAKYICSECGFEGPN
ncbi:DUF1610 domain-containing protein [Candidatus Woesearchaeota archaeon]|nr:DUF1610 domain-containing protein [Candidatus Woesearchaeota archaeon]